MLAPGAKLVVPSTTDVALPLGKVMIAVNDCAVPLPLFVKTTVAVMTCAGLALEGTAKVTDTSGTNGCRLLLVVLLEVLISGTLVAPTPAVTVAPVVVTVTVTGTLTTPFGGTIVLVV